MQPQFDNLLAASLLLWMDNRILTKGRAFSNVGTQLYPITNIYNGYYTYGAPFKPMVSDFSISGANVPTGLYVNGQFIRIGQSGLVDINYQEGQAYFSSPVTGTVSGNYSVKEITLELTDRPEETILFEMKHSIRPRTNEVPTGLSIETTTYPILYLKNDGSMNEPFALGGMDNTVVSFRLLGLLDSQFNSDALSSIIRDSNQMNIPMLTASEMPFNALGGFRTGLLYNYTGLVSQKAATNQIIALTRVFVSKFQVRNSFLTELKDVNPNLYFSLIDLTLEMPRFPRSA